MARVFALTFRNRLSIIVVAGLIAVVGVIFVTVGLAVLAALAVGGAVLGAGIAAYSRLRGGSQASVRHRVSTDSRLDPSLEVQPKRPAIVESRETLDQ